jgi:hypothetical protein
MIVETTQGERIIKNIVDEEILKAKHALTQKLGTGVRMQASSTDKPIKDTLRTAQSKGGKGKLPKEKKFYASKFAELKIQHPHLEDGKISTKIWRAHRDNHLSSLSKDTGRETLRRWQKNNNLGF